MRNLSNIRPDSNLIRHIKGFLDPDEGNRLFEIALEASLCGPCLEIGSYCGKSAVYLGTACKIRNSVLFSIDHHRGSEEQQPGEEYFDPELFDIHSYRVDTFRLFRQTLGMADLENTVVPVVCKSEIAARAWTTPLGLVFIDGGHAFETARTDYEIWSPHIASGGYLLIHDIFKDPADGGQAPYQVYQIAKASGLFQEFEMTRTLGVLQRVVSHGTLMAS